MFRDLMRSIRCLVDAVPLEVLVLLTLMTRGIFLFTGMDSILGFLRFSTEVGAFEHFSVVERGRLLWPFGAGISCKTPVGKDDCRRSGSSYGAGLNCLSFCQSASIRSSIS